MKTLQKNEKVKQSRIGVKESTTTLNSQLKKAPLPNGKEHRKK